MEDRKVNEPQSFTPSRRSRITSGASIRGGPAKNAMAETSKNPAPLSQIGAGVVLLGEVEPYTGR
jgi:hypothetical protein